MSRQKEEAVTASYHYLMRSREDSNGRLSELPFSFEEFDNLCKHIQSLDPLDLSDPEIADLVRYRQIVPLGNLERIDNRTAFGQFEASYWGHSYKNNQKGIISADSISLRPFFYLLYFSEDGKIYVGAQYLGTFGSYTGLRNTIYNFMQSSGFIQSKSIRLGASAYRNYRPVAINVEVSNRGKTPAHAGSIGARTAVTFKKSSKDDGFESEVSQRLFPAFDKDLSAVKQAVASLVNDSDLMSIDDKDIENASIVVMKGKKRKVINIIDSGVVATRFNLDVECKSDGHPVYDQAKYAMQSVLRDEILRRRP